MRITNKFKTALFMAKRKGIREISVTTGVKFGRTYFVVIPIRILLRMEVGQSYIVPKYGQPTSNNHKLITERRCRYKDVFEYINNLGKQEDLEL